MSDALLDYSSWSFQLITVLAVLYLVFGLIKPAWVLATKRSTIVIVSAVVMLLAATALLPRGAAAARCARRLPQTIGTEPPCHSRPQRSPNRSVRQSKSIDRAARGLPQKGSRGCSRAWQVAVTGARDVRQPHRKLAARRGTAIVGLALLYLVAGLASPSLAFASGRGAVVLRAGLAIVSPPPPCSSASSPIRIRSPTGRTRSKAISRTTIRTAQAPRSRRSGRARPIA